MAELCCPRPTAAAAAAAAAASMMRLLPVAFDGSVCGQQQQLQQRLQQRVAIAIQFIVRRARTRWLNHGPCDAAYARGQQQQQQQQQQRLEHCRSAAAGREPAGDVRLWGAAAAEAAAAAASSVPAPRLCGWNLI